MTDVTQPENRLPGESPCHFLFGGEGMAVCTIHGWAGHKEQRSRVLVCPNVNDVCGACATEVERETSTDNPRRPSMASDPSRYELLNDDDRFGLKAGDILICRSHGWPWSVNKVVVERRESDGFDPNCSQYRADVKHLSGPVL